MAIGIEILYSKDSVTSMKEEIVYTILINGTYQHNPYHQLVQCWIMTDDKSTSKYSYIILSQNCCLGWWELLLNAKSINQSVSQSITWTTTLCETICSMSLSVGKHIYCLLVYIISNYIYLISTFALYLYITRFVVLKMPLGRLF